MNKLTRDGKVAIIYSPGFGAGWSTWNDEKEMIFDPILATMILGEASPEEIFRVAKERYPNGFVKGIGSATVDWLEEGTTFHISEYDGHESIFLSEHLMITA